VLLWLTRKSSIAAAGELMILATYLIAIFWGSRLTVQSDGLILYRLYRLSWTDVVSARARAILGIRYLQVWRRAGSSLWIPLYFVGKSDLMEVLLSRVPPGNPIHECLQSTGALRGAQ
jgi:hypothetical protein